MPEYIVRLEDNVWLTDGDGDPPRTIVRDSAKRFETFEDAAMALGAAKRIRPFRWAGIEEADGPGKSAAAERLTELQEAERKIATLTEKLRALSADWKRLSVDVRSEWYGTGDITERFAEQLDEILETT